MNKRIQFTNFMIVAAMMVSVSYAGTIKSRGTAGAYELSIPVGARGVALNGANLAIVSGVEALYYNPAGASNLERGFEAQFSNMSYIAGIDITYAAFVANAGGAGTFGFSIKSLDFGDIMRTTAENTEGTGETFSPSFITATATWSKAFTDRIRFGVNMKLVSETILRSSASGIASDLGVQYGFANLPVRIGISLKNIGSKMQFTGSDLEHKLTPQDSQAGTKDESFQAVSEGFEMPAELIISVAYSPIAGLSLLGSFQNSSFTNNDLRFGGVYSIDLGPASVWAGGAIAVANVEDTKPDDVDKKNWDEYSGSIFGASYGVGVAVPIGNIKVSFETGMRTVTDYFDNNQVWSIKLAF